MASVHRDSRGFSKYWYACFTSADGRRRMISTRETDREKAKVIAEAWERAERVAAKGGNVEEQIRKILNETLERAGLRTVEVTSLRDWLTGWLAGRRNLAKSTRQEYSQAFDQFLKFMGSRSNAPIETVTELDINGFVDSLVAKGLSNSTVDKITRKFLAVPFSKALKLGKIRFNPVMATDPLPKEERRREAFSPEAVARLIAAADAAPGSPSPEFGYNNGTRSAALNAQRSRSATDWRGAITLGYCSAIRLQDIANLEWSAIDMEHGLIWFHERKKKQMSCVGLHPDFQDWLAEQTVADDQKFVFPTLAGRTGPNLGKQFNRIIEAAGVESRVVKERSGKGHRVRSHTFHSLRHSATSGAYNQAAAEDIARRVSGHSGEVIRGYLHVDANNLKAAVNLIPRLPKS